MSTQMALSEMLTLDLETILAENFMLIFNFQNRSKEKCPMCSLKTQTKPKKLGYLAVSPPVS